MNIREKQKNVKNKCISISLYKIETKKKLQKWKVYVRTCKQKDSNSRIKKYVVWIEVYLCK